MDTLLDKLLSPGDLKRLGEADLDRLASEIRERVKSVVSTNGGHLASNLGVVELTIALHRVFDFSSDRLLWDVGHQAYAHKLLTGRVDGFARNRQRGGTSGFPDPLESPYDVAKVGHSSTAISTAVGLAESYRRQGLNRKVVVVVGDGALTGGMSFEGLINAGELGLPLLVVLNDNGTFIDKPVGAMYRYLDRLRSGTFLPHMRERIMTFIRHLPMGGTLSKLTGQMEAAAIKLVHSGFIFEDLGFRYFGPEFGHDRAGLEKAIRNVAHLDRPVLLHVHTRKGEGWEPSTQDPCTFHGPRGFDLETGVFHAKPRQQMSFSQVFGAAMCELAEEDPEVVAVTAAMCSGTGLRPMAERFPDRVYDVGICEQHSFAFVQGLAMAGQKPVLAHYSTFAQRGFDQFFQELVLSRDLGVVLTLDRAGLVGEDGETHQGLYDIAWTRTMPGTVLCSPKDGDELRTMLRWAHTERSRPTGRPAVFVIRYPRGEASGCRWGLEQNAPMILGRAETIQVGSGLAVIAYGPILEEAWKALRQLGSEGRGVTLVNARFAKPFDTDLLTRLVADHDRILTVEDHALSGGFGAIVCESVADRGLALEIHRAGVPDRLIGHATREEQLAEAGLDAASLAVRIRDLIGVRAVVPFPRAVNGGA